MHNFLFRSEKNNSFNTNKTTILFACLVLAIFMYFPIFYHLDRLPIRIFDEARLATNAYEMYKDGDHIVTHFEGKPDMWNTKPPLLIWLQATLMKFLGVNELAMRLPSAFAALLTCGLLLIISVKYLGSFWFGCIAVLVLITSQGYVDIHCTRTGDYDSLLIFFTTLYCFSYFAFLETGKNKYLYYFFISLSLAVLTKSVTGVLFLPGLFLYTVFSKKLFDLFKNKHLYVGIILFLSLAGGYYLLRNMYNPGYIRQVWENELGGRYLETLEGHQGPLWFYVKYLVKTRYTYWVAFAFCGTFIGIFHANPKFHKLTVFSLFLVTTFLVIISVSQTKLSWYDAPMFPLLAIIVSMCIYSFCDFLQRKDLLKFTPIFPVAPILFLIIVFSYPYKKILNKVTEPVELTAQLQDVHSLSYFLKDASEGKNKVDGFYLLSCTHAPHADFYYFSMLEKGMNIRKKDYTLVNPGENVIAYDYKIKVYIESNFNYKVISQFGNVKLYHIDSKEM